MAWNVSTAAAIPPPPGSEFGIESFITEVLDEGGNEETRAGAHPHSARAEFRFDSYDPQIGDFKLRPYGEAKTITVKLPPGFTGNPQAAEACPLSQVGEQLGLVPVCPPESFVGYVDLKGLVDVYAPVIRVTPEPGYPAEFAFSAVGLTFPTYAELRSDSDYGVDMVVPAANQNFITGVDFTFCGSGVNMVDTGFGIIYGCKVQADPGAFKAPFLTNPASECPAEQPFTDLVSNTWQVPDTFVSARALSPRIVGCEDLEFNPVVEIRPTTLHAAAPTGLEVDMRFPQEDNPLGQAPPALKKAVVTLPEGMSLNAAAADGLGACSDGDLKLKSKAMMSCPESAKIATATATSPLLDQAINGDVYIRSQNSSDPSSGEMFRLALVFRNEDRGIDVRLPGAVRIDGATGRIVAEFDNNPELPVDRISLSFKQGPRAPLSNPPTCGAKTITTDLTSWGGQTVSEESTFTIACSPELGGFQPSFLAGTDQPEAGTFASFSLNVGRQSSEQELKGMRSIKMPEGLLAKIASVELCPDAAADAGSCGAGSRIGHLQAAVGAGSTPLWVPQAGRKPTSVHLTGPYRGAPYGLSIVVPAQAGPFDLGTVVVRSAIHVDERTAQITTGVDQARIINPDGTVGQVLEGDIPRIVKGVVLNQREIRVIVDRDEFMVNPTDCSPQSLSAELLGYGGGQASVSNRFRAAECASLGFAPRFNARILDKGRRSTLRSWHPRTRFTVVPRRGDANIGGARVALPSSTILDQSNIGTTCTRAQMAERACPAKSVVGYARAWSPLLRKAVEGPVYLAANGGVRPLPDLAAVLDGEIRVVLQGEISTLRTGGKARLQNTFRVVPDAPVSRFVLTMRGGKNTGLLVNSTDLCRTNERGVAVFAGQNGRQHRLGLRLATSFKGCAKVRRQAARRVAARKAEVRKAARNVG